MKMQTFLQTLTTIVVIMSVLFVFWLIAKNITPQQIRIFTTIVAILGGAVILLFIIMSLGIWNFKTVSKTIHETGATYFVTFNEMLAKISENSNNKNPIIIHNSGVNSQAIPDQKTSLALNNPTPKKELEYITLKELSQENPEKELNPEFFKK